MPSNFPSFSNRSFGHPPQHQQQQQPANDSQKVYHVPIHIEQDDGQPNSYIKISEPSGYQTGGQRQPNNNSYYQSNPAEQMHYERSHSPSNRAPSPFFNHHSAADANHLNDFRDRSEQEFKRQSDELFKRRAEEMRGASSSKAPSAGQQGSEYRIPIRIEGESDSSNLVRDFNKMHCPSAARTSKPGQKNSTPTGEFVNSKDFNNGPQSYQQPQFNQQNSYQFDEQQQQQQPQQNYSDQQPQQQRPSQQPKKVVSPMAIVQDILEEVEKYEHEVDYFKGVYQDKQWRYLDEYLTRCMLKLDTIETCGDMNLKQARKNALNYINKVIAKLENVQKAPSEEKTGEKVGDDESKKEANEMMEQDEAGANVESNKDDVNGQSQAAAVKEDEPKVDDKSADDQNKKESDNPKSDAKSKDKSDKKAKSEEKKAEKKKASKKPDGKDKKKIKKDSDQSKDN